MRDGQTTQNRGRSSKGTVCSRRRIVLIAAFILVLGGGYLALRLSRSYLAPTETTDPGKYGAILKNWSTSPLVSHFPPAIPPQAANVRFSAFPGFQQGGAHIQLRMQLPPEEIGHLGVEFRQSTTHIYTGGGFLDHYNADPKTSLPTTQFHTADNPATAFEFPSHYTLYVLHAKDGGSWNHGETAGTAISTTANEVIYWAERW